MSDDSKNDAIDAFFNNTDAAAPRVVDLLQLGAPPRTMTPDQKALLDKLPPTRFALWVMLAVLFTPGIVMMFVFGDDMPLAAYAQACVLPGFFAFLAYRSFVDRRDARQRYYRVFERGVLTMAKVMRMHVTEYRGKLRSASHHQLWFTLPNGKQAQLVTWDTGVDFLAPGMDVEALWLDELPDVIIPVQILPA